VCVCPFTHYCTDPDVTLGNGRWCPLAVHCWADFQSVHGFRCCDSIAPNAKCQRVLVLDPCLVYLLFICYQIVQKSLNLVECDEVASNFRLRQCGQMVKSEQNVFRTGMQALKTKDVMVWSCIS